MATQNPDQLVRVSVFVQAHMLAQLRAVAARQGVPAAHLIRAALEKALGSHRPPPRGSFLP